MTDFGPNRPGEASTLSKAIKRPPATKAGINGTKMSDSSLMNAITGFVFWFLAATCFSSWVDISFKPVILTISS